MLNTASSCNELKHRAEPVHSLPRGSVTPKSTVYNFSIDLSDVDRGVYEALKLPVALHPSENLEFMVTRLLARVLEHAEGIAFSPGIGAPDEPTVSVKGLDGTVLSWIEIGSPNAERLHRASKAAQRVAVYCHRSADLVYAELLQEPIFRGEEISFYSFEGTFISDFARSLERRNDVRISRTDQTLYLSIQDKNFSTPLIERRLSSSLT